MLGSGYGATFCEVCEDWTADEDGICEACIERADEAAEVLGAECRHGLTVNTCGICLGLWDGYIRSKITGGVISSPDLISWFVPSTLGHRSGVHPVASEHLGRSGNGCPSSRDGSGVEVIEDGGGLGDIEGVRVFDLGTVGRPAWYREAVLGERTTSDAASDLGLDWYGLSEVQVKAVEDTLGAVGTIAPVLLSSISTAESADLYRGAVYAGYWDLNDQRERLREWRAATGRGDASLVGVDEWGYKREGV